MMIKIFKSKLK